MKHKMNLQPKPYQSIAEGRKTIEMRLNDEKRSSIKVGDIIEFENLETHSTIQCLVLHLIRFKDFDELYAHNDKSALGYSDDETADPKDMLTYYSLEQIAQYGTLAIEVKLI